MKTLVQEDRRPAPLAPAEEDGDGPAPPAPTGKPNGRSRKAIVAVMLLLVLAVGGYTAWQSGRGYESTDDAFLEAAVYNVAPRVSGTIKAVHVSDNQVVKAGDLLFEIDDEDFQVALDLARAQLAVAQAEERAGTASIAQIDARTAAGVEEAHAQLTAAQARLAEARTALEASRAEADRTQADLVRYQNLQSGGAVSEQQLGTARAAAAVSSSNLQVALRRIGTAEAEVAASQAGVTSAEAERRQLDTARAGQEGRAATVREREASLRQAGIDLERTRIRAAADAQVTNKIIQPGDYIREGSVVLMLVGRSPWVVSNFKETQLADMHVGQPVSVHVDAYDIELPAHVESLQAGTGARFSLLPPQNATGNYVKVVQRVPVKIVFDKEAATPDRQFAPGMTVTATVSVR